VLERAHDSQCRAADTNLFSLTLPAEMSMCTALSVMYWHDNTLSGVLPLFAKGVFDICQLYNNCFNLVSRARARVCVCVDLHAPNRQ
jgi:hypothetical protein